MPAADDNASREAAGRTGREDPAWVLVLAIYTTEFVCFPRVSRAGRTILVALYPDVLPARMRRSGMPCGLARQETGRDQDPRPAPDWIRGGPEATDIFPA